MNESENLRGKRFKRGGKYYIFVQNKKTGRIHKGTNKRWSSGLTVKRHLITLEERHYPKDFGVRQRYIVTIKYTPKTTQKYHYLIAEVQVDLDYPVDEDNAYLIRSRVDTHLRVNNYLKNWGVRILNAYVETDRIPYNEIYVRESNFDVYPASDKISISVDVTLIVRGREQRAMNEGRFRMETKERILEVL